VGGLRDLWLVLKNSGREAAAEEVKHSAESDERFAQHPDVIRQAFAP